jgi:glutathione S-transferase
MKLYLTPGACSLAVHICLHETGLAFETIRVDIPSRRTADGADYLLVNPKGYVPALVLNDGRVLTELVAILFWIAERTAILCPTTPVDRALLVESMTFISTEIHKPFLRYLFPTGEAEKSYTKAVIVDRLAYVATQVIDGFLVGGKFSPADALLYVMLTWAKGSHIPISPSLEQYHEEIGRRQSIIAAVQHEQ